LLQSRVDLTGGAVLEGIQVVVTEWPGEHPIKAQFTRSYHARRRAGRDRCRRERCSTADSVDNLRVGSWAYQADVARGGISAD
jgi:hypothetical protein